MSVCAILAIMLLTAIINVVVSGFIFAAALIVLGGLSNGFRNDKHSSKSNTTNTI